MSGDLQTYQMAGVLMPTARYVQLVPTGEMHNGVEVVEPRDVTLYVESLKSAWDKQHGIAEAEIERLKQRIAQLEAGQPKREPLTDELTTRDKMILRFALYRFIWDARQKMTDAAQDKDQSHYRAGAVEAFAKDAEDAEALFAKYAADNDAKGQL